MFDLRTVLICFIGLAFLPGRISSGRIVKDDCSSRFLSSLIQAGYGIDNKVDLTINLKYEDDEGAKKKAAIKLRDKCSEPKILCDGEAKVLNKKMVTGPLLMCSWKWNEKDDTTRNYVIVRLNHKKAIEVSGSISRDSENVFPRASDKGPLDFKFTTLNWNSEGDKKTYRVRREEDGPDNEEEEEDEEGEEEEGEGSDDTEEEENIWRESHIPPTKPPPPPPHTTIKAPTSTHKASKAEPVVRVANKLSYALWMASVSFLIFALK